MEANKHDLNQLCGNLLSYFRQFFSYFKYFELLNEMNKPSLLSSLIICDNLFSIKLPNFTITSF